MGRFGKLTDVVMVVRGKGEAQELGSIELSGSTRVAAASRAQTPVGTK